LVLTVAATGAAWACNPQAQLTLDGATYSTGQVITVFGSYFPGGAAITVTGPGGSKTVTTSPGGAFSTSFVAPGEAGTYVISASRPTGGFASTAFSVTAPPPATPLPQQPEAPPALPVLIGLTPSRGPPPRLRKPQAIRDLRAAIRAEFKVRARSPRCRRASRLRFACSARWAGALRRYRGTVVIRRTGLRTSPLDQYRIRARSTSSFLRQRRHRASGRIVVNPRRALLGQTLRLLGTQDTTDIEVTAGPQVDPFPVGELNQPAAGTRFVAIPMRVVNRAGRSYADVLSKGAEIVTTDNTSIRATLAPGCPQLINVPAGKARLGCVAFEVPFGVVGRQLEYRANSGSGRETGTWALP
jgi:hypothetical protein